MSGYAREPLPELLLPQVLRVVVPFGAAVACLLAIAARATAPSVRAMR